MFPSVLSTLCREVPADCRGTPRLLELHGGCNVDCIAVHVGLVLVIVTGAVEVAYTNPVLNVVIESHPFRLGEHWFTHFYYDSLGSFIDNTHRWFWDGTYRLAVAFRGRQAGVSAVCMLPSRYLDVRRMRYKKPTRARGFMYERY